MLKQLGKAIPIREANGTSDPKRGERRTGYWESYRRSHGALPWETEEGKRFLDGYKSPGGVGASIPARAGVAEHAHYRLKDAIDRPHPTGQPLQKKLPRPARARFETKPKPRWDVHLPGAGNRGGSLAGVFRPLIAGPSGSAVSPRLSGWTARPAQEFADTLLHRRPAAQAQIASDLLSRPTPDSLIGVEVRAVARQVHQPQLQFRRPEVLPLSIAT